VFHILDHGYAQLIRYLDPERTIVTCHDLIPLLAGEGVIPVQVPATVVRTFRWRIAQMHNARAVIADSHATKTMLERYTSVQPERIVVVPLGVSSTFRHITDPQSTTRATAGVAESSSVILQVATAGRYKNTTVLLETVARVKQRLPDVVLVRIGVPFYPDEADLAATLGIGSSIRYVGIVDDSTLAAWYRAADVLVFPSLWEGFGWPPLEAMACGTPVVASNIPALAEIVGDAGILVPADDPSAVARATERVLTDPALADSLRQKGLERASQYTWTRTAAETAVVYDQVSIPGRGLAI
jgi:glycosyltransferase involved in cell wall biosynthesis